MNGIRTSAIAPPDHRGEGRLRRAQLRHEQREEERRERAVETEVLRVAERVTCEHPDRGAAEPRDVQEEPGPEQEPAVEAASAPARERPRLVHDQL